MLTNELKEQLFAFTKKKQVHYYDVQVELVDHLASSIEDEMEQDPKLSFESALQKVYKRFGIFGFTHVVQEKQRAVEVLNKRIWKSSFKSFFTLPKLFLSLSIFMLAYYMGQFLSPGIRYLVFAGIWLALQILEYYNRFRTKPQRSDTHLLLTQNVTMFSGSTFLLWWLIVVDEIKSNLILAILMMAYIICLLAFIEVARYLYREARERYPKAFVSK